MDNQPSVGVAVVVENGSKILLGKDTRKGDVYAVPGGHWESGETLKECGVRETKEESGVSCNDLTVISVYDFYRADKHKSYVTIGMKARYVSGELTNLDSEGRLGWSWYEPSEALKLNLFPADKILIERYLSGGVFD